MRDHGFLYILLPNGEPGDFERLGESNSAFPTLWALLLSDGAIASAGVKRVLCTEGAQIIAADAVAGAARFERFREFLSPCLQRDDMPGVVRYLDGAQQHLREVVNTWTFTGQPAPVFAVSFDERQRPAGTAAEQFMQQELLRFARAWNEFEQATRGDAAAMQRFMDRCIRQPLLRDWRAWAGVFGLALFTHRYFADAFRQPFEMEYVDYDYDPLGSDADLGDGLYRYKQQGRWGVRRIRGRSDEPVLAPEWDRVLRAAPGGSDVVWVLRGQRYGLAAIAGERAGQLLCEPVLDEAGPFHDGLAVARIADRAGFLRNDGRWHLQPAWDELWPYLNGRAAMSRGQRLGYLDLQGTVIAPPRFDEAGDFNATGVARVAEAGRCGLLRADGSMAMSLECSAIEWSPAFDGWRCERDGAALLLRADGSPWLGGFDGIDVQVPQHSIRVKRGGRVGLMNWSATAEILPLDFSDVQAFEPQDELTEQLVRPDMARVYSMAEAARPLAGVWDLNRQCCVVPCRYDVIWLILLGDGSHGFLVANRVRATATAGADHVIGILRADGSVLIPQEYAWIAHRTALGRGHARDHIRGALYLAWSRGRPVPACVASSGVLVGLSADGTSSPG